MSRSASFLTTEQFHRLNHACMTITDHFGHHPYLVGSALEGKDFRDVDVRLILADDEFDVLFSGKSRLWSALCLGLSSYLSEVSGLPIDFQVQRMTEANKKHTGMRNPIGTRARWFAGLGDATNFDDTGDRVLPSEIASAQVGSAQSNSPCTERSHDWAVSDVGVPTCRSCGVECRAFRYIGQSLRGCDNCGQHIGWHDGYERVEGLFGMASIKLVPWEPGDCWYRWREHRIGEVTGAGLGAQ